MPKQQIAERVRRAAEILGLVPYLERYPRQLSGGQRQRVAMGRAIVRDPKVFLFDEPLSNLDAKLRVQMRAEIKELHQRLKTTTVYVTHDQVEAMTMADKIVVLHDGVVEQIGSPLELYDRPANLFVAGFIGSPAMNMIQGVIRPGATPAFEAEDGTRLPLGSVPGNSDGRKAIYGFRPEHLALGGPVKTEITRDRTDRFGDPGGGAPGRAEDRRRVPRAHLRPPGRGAVGRAQSFISPSVRRGLGTAPAIAALQLRTKPANHLTLCTAL